MWPKIESQDDNLRQLAAQIRKVAEEGRHGGCWPLCGKITVRRTSGEFAALADGLDEIDRLRDTIERIEAVCETAQRVRLDFAGRTFGEDAAGRWYNSASATVSVAEIRKILDGEAPGLATPERKTA